jgi:hypothetical protein
VSNIHMRVCLFVVIGFCSLAGAVADTSGVGPEIVYGTYLGGRDKECAMGIAIDGVGNAYVVGRTPSRDFPVTAGAFRTATRVNNDDWTGFVSKVNESGSQLVYSTFLGGNFDSSANAIAVDRMGRAFVVGSTCSANFPTTATAILAKAPGSDKVDVCDGFAAWLNAEGSRLEYGTYLGGRRSDAATAVALGAGGSIVYIGGYTSSEDFPVAGSSAQEKLNGSTNGFLVALDVRSGKLVYSTYLGGAADDRVSSVAVSPDGKVYVGGVTNSKSWPGVEMARLGRGGGMDGFVVRIDPTGKARPVGVRIGGSGDESLAAIAVDSKGDVYAVGTTASRDFPVAGANLGRVGSGFVVKLSGSRFGEKQNGVAWSRRIGGHGDDAMLAVSAGMPGSVFVSGRSGSNDFPTTSKGFYRRLEARNDTTLVQLRDADGWIEYATFVGGTQQPNAAWYNDEATGVVATARGDVYLTGCTADDRLPVTPSAFQVQRKGNADAFVLRMKFANSQ